MAPGEARANPKPKPTPKPDPNQVKPGKGPAFVRTKLKNIETRATLDKTWRAGESLPRRGRAQADRPNPKP